MTLNTDGGLVLLARAAGLIIGSERSPRSFSVKPGGNPPKPPSTSLFLNLANVAWSRIVGCATCGRTRRYRYWLGYVEQRLVARQLFCPYNELF